MTDHSMPMLMQVELHALGLLDDPDYYFDDKGRLTANTDKLRRHIAEHGEPWF